MSQICLFSPVFLWLSLVNLRKLQTLGEIYTFIIILRSRIGVVSRYLESNIQPRLRGSSYFILSEKLGLYHLSSSHDFQVLEAWKSVGTTSSNYSPTSGTCSMSPLRVKQSNTIWKTWTFYALRFPILPGYGEGIDVSDSRFRFSARNGIDYGLERSGCQKYGEMKLCIVS